MIKVVCTLTEEKQWQIEFSDAVPPLYMNRLRRALRIANRQKAASVRLKSRLSLKGKPK